jgi:hypothetical protein
MAVPTPEANVGDTQPGHGEPCRGCSKMMKEQKVEEDAKRDFEVGKSELFMTLFSL